MGVSAMDVQVFLKALSQTTDSMVAHKEYLTQLDSAIGDADHGINMERGFTKVMAKLDAGSYADLGSVCRDVAMTLMASVGGASGPLYGTLFMRMSMKLKDQDQADLSLFAEALEEGLNGIVALGKAELQDKTMVDALTPAVGALKEAAGKGQDLLTGLESAVRAAQEGMEATIPLVARKGRASYLGERSAGHQDPGATSSYLMLSSFYEALKEGA